MYAKTYLDEIGRKAIHLGSASIPVVYCFASQSFMLKALIPLAVAFLIFELLRHAKPYFRDFVDRTIGRIIRQGEARTLTGATYVVLGGLLAVVLFQKPIAISVLLFLSISDALASLVGMRYGKTKLFGKTLVGSLAFLISALLIALVVQPHAPLVAVIGALVAAVTEALPLKIARQKIDDNLSIPLIAGAAMTCAAKAAAADVAAWITICSELC